MVEIIGMVVCVFLSVSALLFLLLIGFYYCIAMFGKISKRVTVINQKIHYAKLGWNTGVIDENRKVIFHVRGSGLICIGERYGEWVTSKDYLPFRELYEDNSYHVSDITGWVYLDNVTKVVEG